MTPRFTFGELLRDIVAAFLKNAGSLIAIVAIPTVAMFAMEYASERLETPLRAWAMLAAGIAQFVLGGLIAGAVVVLADSQLRGAPLSLAQCYAFAGRRLLALLVALILITLFSLFGLVLFVVPGLIAMVWMVATIPILVLERRRALESISRSTDLTDGHRWPIFWLILIYFVVGAGTQAFAFVSLPESTLLALFFTLEVLTQSLWGVAQVVVYRKIQPPADVAEVFE